MNELCVKQNGWGKQDYEGLGGSREMKTMKTFFSLIKVVHLFKYE